MKAIKINAKVNLQSGIQLPLGSIVVIAEGYADVKAAAQGAMPAQVATNVYASLAALTDGKAPVQDVADFNPVFSGLSLLVTDFETKAAEVLLVDAVSAELAAIYTAAKIEIVQL